MTTKEHIASALLSEEEIERITLGLLTVRGAQGVTETEAADLVAACRGIRFWAVALELVLQGRALFDLDGHGEPVLVMKPAADAEGGPGAE